MINLVLERCVSLVQFSKGAVPRHTLAPNSRFADGPISLIAEDLEKNSVGHHMNPCTRQCSIIGWYTVWLPCGLVTLHPCMEMDHRMGGDFFWTNNGWGLD
jgi:hypothetical protein